MKRIIVFVALAVIMLSAGAMAITCSQDSGCPPATEIGQPYCEDGMRVQELVIWSCISSQCQSSVTNSTQQCEGGCVDDVRYVAEATCLEDVACPDVYLPVCGFDLVTYSTECDLFVSGQEKIHDGECRRENTPPVLINASLNPLSGSVDTQFDFSVVYTDADNDRGRVELEIDGQRFEMNSPKDGNLSYTGGETYLITTNLSAGIHSYRFIATDGYRNVSTQVFTGPQVSANTTIINPSIRMGEGVWSPEGEFSGSSAVTDFTDQINQYLDTCVYVDGFCRVPVTFRSDSAGRVEFSGLHLFVYPSLKGDADNNNKVDIFDLARLGRSFGRNFGDEYYDPNADLNADGEINIADLATIGLNYGKTL